jgi:hypothetical protein
MGQPEPSRPLRLPLGSLPTEPFARRGQWLAAGFVAAVCAGLAFAPLPGWAAASGVVATLVGAVAARRGLLVAATRPVGFLVTDERGVFREGPRGRETLARWGEPFGVTLLAGKSRQSLVVAFTTRERARYVPIDGASDEGASTEELVRQATTLADDELAPVDDDARLAASSALSLLRTVAQRAPQARERIYLTAARGEPVELEGRMLRAGERVIDLAAPVDSRSYCFHESGGRVTTLYQATWVRQAEHEMALVAPQPGEPTAAGDPPPREIRYAIDRVFMMALRRAIEKAPRASRPNLPPNRRLREGRP